jgi:hypothetical protein
VHWIDAEWIYPPADIVKYDEPKIFITEIKKRSSGSPCVGWVVRYEIMGGGPNAGLGPNQSKAVEVPTGPDGKAAIELYLLEGQTGTSTVKATIIRPSGVDRGTRQLELHSHNLINHWSSDAPLRIVTNAPPTIRWNERAEWSFNVENRSSVAKSGTISLPLPAYVQLMSSTPQTTSVTPQSDGSKLVTWQVMEFPPMTTTQIRFVLQAVTTEPSPPQLELVLHPKLTIYSSRDTGTGSSTPQSGSPPQTFAPQDSSGSPSDSWGGGSNLGGVGYGNVGSGATTMLPAPPQQGHSDPVTFANQLTCDFQKIGATVAYGRVNEIAVVVTNNASTPFYQGYVEVTLPEGLVFCDASGTPRRDENGNYQTVGSLYFIDHNTNQEIPIQPHQSETISFYITPTKLSGNLTLKAFVVGQSQNSDPPAYIAGAEKTRTFNVVSQ